MIQENGDPWVPDVFDRLRRVASYERRRRWNATASAASGEMPAVPASPMPAEILGERFDSVEAEVAELARELNRIERRARRMVFRSQLAMVLALVLALTCVLLSTGMLREWLGRVHG